MKLLGHCPSRLSFFGSGTDLPVYSDIYGGLVINMAINLRQHMEISDDDKWDIPPQANLSFYENTFRALGLDHPRGFKTYFDGEIEGGLGTSASAAVLMSAMVERMNGYSVDPYEIAETAFDVEVNRLGLYGGKQDQLAAAFGGANIITFDKEPTVQPLDRLAAFELANHTLLFYTGKKRTDPKVQEQLLNLTQGQTTVLHQIKNTAKTALGFMFCHDWKDVGKLMDTSWELKKLSNPKASNSEINLIYSAALTSGAWGGKLCGSGGGGYMIFMAPKDKHLDITAKLQGLGCTPVDFDISYDGVEVRILEP